jgi:hypothetical protein
LSAGLLADRRKLLDGADGEDTGGAVACDLCGCPEDSAAETKARGPAPTGRGKPLAGTTDPRERNWHYRPVLRDVGYARVSSSTGMVRTPAVWRAYSAKPL